MGGWKGFPSCPSVRTTTLTPSVSGRTCANRLDFGRASALSAIAPEHEPAVRPVRASSPDSPARTAGGARWLGRVVRRDPGSGDRATEAAGGPGAEQSGPGAAPRLAWFIHRYAPC